MKQYKSSLKIKLQRHFIYFLKRHFVPLAATRMNLEIIILSEVSQTKTNIICYHLYVESKMIQMNIYSKQNKFIFKEKK